MRLSGWIIVGVATVALGGCGVEAPSGGDVPSELEVVRGPAHENLERAAASLIKDRREIVERLEAETASRLRRARAWGELGRAYHAYRFHDQAAASYRNARRLDPTEILWTYLLAHVDRAQGRTSQAAEGLRQVVAARPEQVAPMVWAAELAIDSGEIELGRQLFERALAVDPGCARARLGLGRLAVSDGDDDLAVEHFRAVIGVAPSHGSAYYALAMALRRQGDVTAAEVYLNKVRSHPAASRPVPMADPWLDAVDELARGAMGHEHRGGLALEAGDFRLAAIELKLALALTPNRSDARLNLVLALLRLGREEEAQRELLPLLETGTFAPAHLLVASMTLARGETESTRDHLRRALDLDSGSALSKARLGELELALGREAAARAAFEAAVKADPSSVEALAGLVVVDLLDEEFEASTVRLEELVASLPTAAALRLLLVRALSAPSEVEWSDPARALELLGPTAAMVPSAEAETRAMALAATGETRRARAWQSAVVERLELVGADLDAARRRLSNYAAGRAAVRPWAERETLLSLRMGPMVAAPDSEFHDG